MCFCAQCMQNASDFDGDIAGTDHNRLSRLFSQCKETIRVDTKFGTGYCGNGRAAADGDRDMIGRNLLTVYFNCIWANKLGKAFNIINLVAFKTTMVSTVNALNV